METVHADHSRILVGRGRFTSKDLLSGSAALGTFTFPAASSSVQHCGREGGVGPAGRRFPCTLLQFRSLVGEGAAAACELMCEQAEEEPSEQAYASSIPLLKEPFIHLRDKLVPTLIPGPRYCSHTLLPPCCYPTAPLAHASTQWPKQNCHSMTPSL